MPIKPLLLGGLMTLSLSAMANTDSVIIKYATGENAQQKAAMTALKQSGVNPLLVELSNQHFPFEKALTIQYGGEDGPLYDPETHVVHMPYNFYQQALNYFKANDYEKKFGKSAEAGAIDTILHTLLHEAGHAYIEDQNIPILGKEEDAVDNFAVVMMIEYVEDGDDAAISAADMFAFESDDRPDYYDFGEYIDEHSFDLQRYFSTLCLVYGSDPDKHAGLLDEVENDYLSERKEFCEFQYPAISQSWHHYLRPQKETND
ncbi:DUF4344 domain-containing metallopeptidase [Vibrio sp. LaRot3]|uniref:DUF4344 domain-containing metallopeptidase n=1 Tax=Vibrio sp. LaRot3 TaxID=2998829 RepID=UPI0022CDE195|nr:DUF4344 domain-containing metallopeptidase [Vibrio sp. LaRot3]MDA0149015.1 DUF4344 domain-containing metallopeptidase [Vibrio sp. LaRot3]